MDNSLVEILVIFVLLIINGIFAMSELAILAARKIRLQQKSEEGDKSARVALDLAETPNRFLSTVQIGITLVGILAGAFGGATLATKLGDALEPSLGNPASGIIAVGVVVAAITYLSLIIGELVPKRLALQHAETLASRLARPLRVLSIITAPAVALLSASTEGVLR